MSAAKVNETTIEEAKERKLAMEILMGNMLDNFCKETKLTISYIHLWEVTSQQGIPSYVVEVEAKL